MRLKNRTLLALGCFSLIACQSLRKSGEEAKKTVAPETAQVEPHKDKRLPSSYVSVFNCQAQKNISAESEEEAKRLFLLYMNNGTTQSGSVKIVCRNGETTQETRGASNICDTSVGTCFVNMAQPVGSPCGCAGYPGSIAPQK